MTTATTWNETTPARADNVELAPHVSEDWLSLIIGLFIFVLALAGIANVDLLGWAVTTSVWNDIGKALGTVSKSYASLGGVGALFATYVALLVVLSGAAVALKSDIKKFALAFTAVFWIATTLILPRSRPQNCRNSESAGRSGSPMKVHTSLR
jgi:hypothetical protein